MKPFLNWVDEQGGPYVLSKRLSSTANAVANWYRGQATPRVEIIFELVKMGKGRFSVEDVLRETYNKKARKAKDGKRS